MNKLYPFATLLSAILLINSAEAQTYTAVRNGDWHVPSGVNVWDPSGEPPVNCSGCTITISAGAVVRLNVNLTLTGGSVLNINGAGSKLWLDPSNGADWASSFNVILVNDGSNPSNTLKVTNGGLLDATAADANFDGVFTTFSASPTMYFKQIGQGASAYSGSTVANTRNVSTQTMNTGSTLTASGTLPIYITGFDAVPNNGAVDLTWTTQFEQNSDHFDIERSANGGVKWDVAGSIAAKGYSAIAVNYAFTDANPGSGNIQYRIHGYDVDGKPSYSPIKVVRTTPLATVSIFPNPAKDYVNVALPVSEVSSGMISVRLIGQTGQLLAEKRVTGTGGVTLSFPVGSYAPGNYLVQVVTADGSKQVSKVLISRQ